MSVDTAPEPLHRQLGLRDEELELIREALGRDPGSTELAMYAAMWSEHCSYKSSKVHLRTLPTEGPAVLVGPGQDAGAVDVGDGVAAVFKIESHSHPSAIEPYQGAATGVGGIVRDIVSMGARPVALLDPRCSGRSRRSGTGGSSAASSPGSAGTATASACPRSAARSGSRPAFGQPDRERAVRRRGAGGPADHRHVARPPPGSLMVLYGRRPVVTGSASGAASATLDEGSEDSRPSVQIGDPFAEKLLIEASLELAEKGLLQGSRIWAAPD